MTMIETLTEDEQTDLMGGGLELSAKALRIIDQQAARIAELETAFDRLYGDARSASIKLDVSVKRGEAQPAREYERLDELVESLLPLFKRIRSHV